ncbi:hypothetical protein JL720_15917 [Aureococcus anophagefferens]|nr:hypothetical protein JL720_15917 [Aureococcus anophagefferens]
MDGAVAYAAVEHVAWEARIGWGESSDEGSEGEPERAYRASAPGNAYLDAGDWAGAVRWGGDGESDDGARGARRRRRRAAAAGAARAPPPSPATRPGAQALFHRRARARRARGAWTLAAPRADRAGGAARSARRAAPGAAAALAPLHGVSRRRAEGGRRRAPVARAERGAAAPRRQRGHGRRALPAEARAARGRLRRPRRRRFDADAFAAEPWPLLGECAPDDEQLALVSDAFRAPVFPHGAPDAAAPVTDFLLCLARLARARDGPPEPWTWVVRPLDGDHLVALQGQVEPRIEVPPLASHDAPRGRGARDRRALDEIQRALFCNTHVPAALLKRAVADVAEKVRGDGVDLWRAASCRGDDDDAVGGADAARRLAAAEVAVDADDVATRFAPEDVCAYESANAAAGPADAGPRGAGEARRAQRRGLPVRGVADGAGGAEKPASLAESRGVPGADRARRRGAAALKRTLADMARGDDDEADDGRLLVGDREFRKRGKRGPYRNSAHDDAARSAARRCAGGGAAGLDDGAGGAPAPAPAPADDGSDLDLGPRERPPRRPRGDGGDGRKAATARDDAMELEALRRDLKDQEERKRDAAARDALRGESGEPEAIRRPPPVWKSTTEGPVKLNISSLMAKHDEHKAEQRRAKEQRMKDDAASYHRRPAPSRRTAPRQGGGAQNKPHVRLAALLRDEVLTCVEFKSSTRLQCAHM